MIDPAAQADEDLALMARADASVFLHLYDRYAPGLSRYVRAYVGDPHEAEDVVGSAFMQALDRIGTFDIRRGTFAQWLFAIARNVIRMRYRRTVESDIENVPERLDSGELPLDVVLREEQSERLRAAMQRLPEDQREALALRYLAELPFTDVAARIGTSEAAAKMRVKRGLQALKRELGQERE